MWLLANGSYSLGGPFEKKNFFFLSLCLLGCERFSLNKGRLCCPSSCENVPRLLQHLKLHFYIDSPPACREKSKLLIQNPEGTRTGPVFAKCHGGVRMTSHYLLENSSTPRVMGYLSLLANLLKEWIAKGLLCYHRAHPAKVQPWSMKCFDGGCGGRRKLTVFWNGIFGTSRHASLPSWNVHGLLIKFQGAEPLRLAFQGNEA